MNHFLKAAAFYAGLVLLIAAMLVIGLGDIDFTHFIGAVK